MINDLLGALSLRYMSQYKILLYFSIYQYILFYLYYKAHVLKTKLHAEVFKRRIKHYTFVFLFFWINLFKCPKT